MNIFKLVTNLASAFLCLLLSGGVTSLSANIQKKPDSSKKPSASPDCSKTPCPSRDLAIEMGGSTFIPNEIPALKNRTSIERSFHDKKGTIKITNNDGKLSFEGTMINLSGKQDLLAVDQKGTKTKIGELKNGNFKFEDIRLKDNFKLIVVPQNKMR